MRRLVVFLGLTLAALLSVVMVSQAQDAVEPPLDPDVIILPEAPEVMIDGLLTLPLEDMSRDGLQSPLALAADAPADSCEEAPLLIISPDAPADGISTSVRDATESFDDPILSCMWGEPSRPRGFRTVWYQLLAPVSGRISLNTFNSLYDTVLGVYTGECGNLVPVQCDDDSNGFTSDLTLGVNEGTLYYIEVADWQPGLPDDALLNFSALLQPVTPLWETIFTRPTSPAISRHSTVAHNGSLYVVGGQTGNNGVPFVSNRLIRLDPFNDRWTDLAQIPGAGYSNTTAALVAGQIFIPSGYKGSDLAYDGLHWRYNIADNVWEDVANVPKANGKNFGWAASAVPPENNRYYLAGGINTPTVLDPEAEVVRDTFVYRVSANTWIRLGQMQAARYAHAGGWIEDNNLGFCVAGGLGVQEGQGDEPDAAILHRSAECYTETTGWRFIGDMQIPRYGAGSVVGPDGRWYIFGGLTFLRNRIVPVGQTEVYDPQRNTWTILGPEYNLGSNFGSLPARAHASGAMIDNDLWVVGGSIFDEGEQAIPLTQRLFIPSNRSHLPVQIGNYDDYLRPDENFGQARPLSFGVTQERDFRRQLDFYDFFYFDLPFQQRVRIDLHVPDDNNFDLFLYGENKLQWGSSTIPFNGVDESLELTLPPRRYFVMVKRVFPTEKPDRDGIYRLTILN